MKEYLTKNSNCDYQLVNHRFNDDDIEVPDGAECCTHLEDNIIFWNGNKNIRLNDSDWLDIGFTVNDYLKEFKSAKIIWQREPKYKEFLNANDNYNLVMLPEHAGDDEKSGLIEVPDGADAYIHVITGTGKKYFYKLGENPKNYKDGKWCEIWNKYNSANDFIKDGDIVLWQRYTQPESLPFVDDEVNHPSHYTAHPSGIECIQITRHHDFAIGNAIKYLWRAGLKNSDNEIQDLEKAIWYIQDKINQLKGL